MRGLLYGIPAFVALSACGLAGDSDTARKSKEKATATTEAEVGDPLAARDAAPGTAAPADDMPRPEMQVQVVLDRLGFTPGVIDGKPGLSTRNAVSGFQEGNNLKVTGEIDEATTAALSQWKHISATRVVTIPAAFAAGSFVPIPDGADKQAALTAMAYETLDEKVAERFHTTVEVLHILNSAPETSTAVADAPTKEVAEAPPLALFKAGQKIRVPNVGNDVVNPADVKNAGWLDTLVMMGISSSQPKADRIVVSKSKGTLKVYDANEKLIGMYTASMGSRRDPLPLGKWKINGVAYNPEFHYNPELFWDVSDSKDDQMLAPGPNGPVGVVWIDLSKEHYGIHGTPEPQTIGRAQSHGCVRLTNWDAARLAQMVSPGVKVLFEA